MTSSTQKGGGAAEQPPPSGYANCSGLLVTFAAARGRRVGQLKMLSAMISIMNTNEKSVEFGNVSAAFGLQKGTKAPKDAPRVDAMKCNAL